MAKNDWIVAGLNNPEFTAYDFSTIADMSLDNTQMLSADEYLKSDFIKNHEMFKDDSGNFSEKKFKQYHQQRLEDFREFQEQEFPKGPQLDMFDTDRTKESKVKDIRFNLGRHVNPDRQAVGIEGVRVWSDPTQTKSEIAQSQKIWDTKKGEFKDYSSNDKALSNGIFDWLGQVFSDPLVMAQWEEDGEHIDPITGLTRLHKKGEYKLNDKGTYYYETLAGRTPIGKEVLSVFDTLTVDGEGINKYDFFDSDDIQKSIGGVIAKNVAVLLPMFTPAGTAYSALLVAKEFSKAIPMLYGFATMFSDNQEAPKWVNNVAAIGTKFSGGTSQYAKENTFSFENFGNLIADVALQWGQQKAIAGAINKLRGADKYVDDALASAKSLYNAKKVDLGESEELWQACLNKFVPEAQKIATQAGQLGRDASLAYMAIVSNSDLYNEMRNLGLTNTEASAVALGSTLGMFGLNKYTDLGEIFFDDATDDAVKLARQSVKAEMKDAVKMFDKIKQSDLPQPNKLLEYIKIASDKTSEVFSKFSDDLKYHTLNFTGKAVGEGLEEVSEELISDVAKEIYQLAGQFGVDTTLKDIGAWDNALERYTMSFLGGAIGGGIFYGKEALIDGKSYKRDSKNWEMATLIRNGHANELRAEVEKLKKEGKIASTTLSASKFEKNDKGERVWLTTESKEDSQNDAVANAMLEKINALEAVINNNRIGLSDEQLFENMVLTEKRYKRYEKIAPLTNYYQDFNNIINDLIAAELDYEKASQTIEGTVNGHPKNDAKLTPEQEATRQQQLAILQQRVEEFRQKKDEFLAGDTSLEYTRKLNFIMDPKLHSQFLSIDQDQFFKEKYGDRAITDLTPEELSTFITDWNTKLQDTLKAEVNQSWQRYKEIEALITPELTELGTNTPEYKKFITDTEKLFSGVLNTDELFASYIHYDTKLEGESDEDFEARNTKLVINGVEETDVEFQLRKLNRIRQIDAYNTQKDKEWADQVSQHLATVNGKVDPFTFRYLRRSLPHRQRDVLDRKLSLAIVPPAIRAIFKTIKPDLSNVDEVKDLVRKSIREESVGEIKSLMSKIQDVEITDYDGNLVDINDYIAQEAGGELTLKEITDNPDALGVHSPELISILNSLRPTLGDDVALSDVIFQGSMLLENNSAIEEYVDKKASVHENQLNVLLTDVKTNPIYSLATSFKSSVKNPIGELVKALSAKNGDEIPNVEEILDLIQEDFENMEDVNQLILDDTQMTQLNKVRDYLKLIDGFIYAASSNPDKNNPYGHNQVINAYANKHKDKLIKEWELLPEIDSDYSVLYNQSIAQYISEIDYWIKMSNNNSVNKIRKFVATDQAFNMALLDTIKTKDLKVTVDDVEYNLLEGVDQSDSEPEINLFNTEQSLHRNFQLALQKSGLSVKDFLRKSGLLEKIIPSISNIAKQKVAKLTDTLKSTDLTDFDLIQYFAQIFTLNPSQFYSDLKGRIKSNENVAPITAQEYSTKLAQAITSKQYRDIMDYAYERSGSKLPRLTNTLIIPGVAGAGKTFVVLSAVNNPDEDVIIAGPTKEQASTLQKALHRPASNTFQEVLINILGLDQYKRIDADWRRARKGIDPKSEFFSIQTIDEAEVVSLNRGALKFNTLEKTPKKIFLDEATHLSSLEAQIIDAYAESVGAVVYMAGDLNQRGYINEKTETENLQEDQIFSSRAPKLSISLRDNNLQKYLNQEAVRSLLDTVHETFLDSTEKKLEAFWPQAINTLSKFNFQVYNHEELNGDLITPDLTPDLLAKIKTSTSIGFVGDKNSAYLQKLQEAGITPEVLSMDEMQGKEFDYVIIDHNWEAPSPTYEVKRFLTNLYTAMTRARTASIFIDNGLSSIIGKNVYKDNKSKAPSILAGAEELRAKKLALLDQFKIDLSEIKADTTPTQNTTTPDPTPAETQSTNPDEDFIDPENKKIDEDFTQEIQEQVAIDEAEVEETMVSDFAFDGEQVVESFTDITILGVTKSEPQKRVVKYNGKDVEITAPVWTITRPQQGPLRNLQAFYASGTELITYDDKQEAQRTLFSVKSAVMFQHGYEDLPRNVRHKISKADWESGSLEIEIREITDSDTTHLNAKYDQAGIEYNGKRYLANIVFKTKLKTGEEVKIDVSGLPSIDTYYGNLKKIKDKLRTRIAKASGDEKTILETRLAGTDATFHNYERLLKDWIAQYESGTFTSIKLSEKSIQFNRTTWLQALPQSSRSDGLQLGGKLNPITGDRSRDTLQLRHPELVFSPIYTYATDPRAFESMDYTLKGKAVVLVSSDTLLRPEQLLDEYISQKANPDSSTARVRLLVLDNYGLTFGQFIDRDFIKSFQKGDETRKPFRQNFTGIRMFTSLWNWRASLIKFNDALVKWQTDNHFTDEQVDVLIQADQMLYDESDPSALLARAHLPAEAVYKVKEFNTKYCEGIPTFRLGYSKNGKGFYVRQENVTGSTVYGKDTVNLLAITPAKAKQFQILIDRVLSSIEASDKFGAETLGVQLLKDDGTVWDKSELIDLTNAKHRRTLSGLLSLSSKTLVLQADGQNLAYADGNQWSMIPALISNVVRTITYFQNHPDQLDNTGQQCAKITIADGSEKIILKTQIGDLFDAKVLQVGNDSSLFDLLNLVFHGTTDDIHKKLIAGSQLMQVEDAYFKRGFLINPDLSFVKTQAGDTDIWKRKDNKGNALFYMISTSPELFLVDTDVRTSGLGIRINELYNEQVEEEKREEAEVIENPEETFKKTYPKLSELIELGINIGYDFEYNMDNVSQVLQWYNNLLSSGIIDDIKKEKPDILDQSLLVELIEADVQYITLGDYLKQQLGVDSLAIEFSDGLIVKTNTGEYKFNSDLSLTRLGVTINEPSSKYQHKVSNGEVFGQALYHILEDTEARSYMIDVLGSSEQELNALHRSLKQLFDSKQSEEDTKEALENISNSNNGENAYTLALMPFIEIHKDSNEHVEYADVYNILNNC